jgi:hypothetical protein
MLGQETVPAINANIAAHLLRPRDPPAGSLVVKELQRDMLAHAEQQRLAGAAPCAAPGAATAGRAGSACAALPARSCGRLQSFSPVLAISPAETCADRHTRVTFSRGHIDPAPGTGPYLAGRGRTDTKVAT